MICQSAFASPGGSCGLPPLLDTAFGAGLGAVLLGIAGCRQDNVGELRGLGQEDILHDQELEVLQALLHVVEVRVGDHRVLTHDVDALDLGRARQQSTLISSVTV